MKYTVFIQVQDIKIILGVFNSPFPAEKCAKNSIELNKDLNVSATIEVTKV